MSSPAAAPKTSPEPTPSERPERPPTYEDYQPPRTTAEGGVMMLVSGIFAAGGAGVLLLAVASKLLDLRAFGQISNLLMTAIVLLLMAVYLLFWEVTIRIISRTEE